MTDKNQHAAVTKSKVDVLKFQINLILSPLKRIEESYEFLM